jgi:hypothetical protein
MTSVPRPSPAQAEAEAAFHQGDPGPRMEMWSRRDPVTLFGAAGMYKFGWGELSRLFPWVASRFSNVSDYRFDVLVADVIGDMAYSVGYERSRDQSTVVRSSRSRFASRTSTAARTGSGRSSIATATIRPPTRARPCRRVRRERTARAEVRLLPLPPPRRPPRRPRGRASRALRSRQRSAPSPTA